MSYFVAFSFRFLFFLTNTITYLNTISLTDNVLGNSWGNAKKVEEAVAFIEPGASRSHGASGAAQGIDDCTES
jgi:hypothetical protein